MKEWILFITKRIEQFPITAMETDKELCRNKLNKDGEGFSTRSKAEKRSNTLCIVSFYNAATGGKDESDRSIYFGTVPKAKQKEEGASWILPN